MADPKAGVDRGTVAVTGGGFGGRGAAVGPGSPQIPPESSSSDTGTVSPAETLLNPDNPSPQAGTPTSPGQEKAGGTAGGSKVD